MAKEPKRWLVALLLSAFLGWAGLDRFYLGYIKLGLFKLLTGGGCIVLALLDLIMIAQNKLPDAEGQPLAK
jgi:TM2 domain-containing membrane protein YozV